MMMIIIIIIIIIYIILKGCAACLICTQSVARE